MCREFLTLKLKKDGPERNSRSTACLDSLPRKQRTPLTEQAKGSNRTKSTVRVRFEHVFGAQANDMGGTLVRTAAGLHAILLAKVAKDQSYLRLLPE